MKNRNLLMIPGPIEYEPAVLAEMGAPTTSHIAKNFIETFGQALERLRDVFQCPDGQPFVLAGSGTLAMDSAASNLVEPGDRALVINTGYFSDRFGAMLERYGAEVTHIRSEIGDCPALDVVKRVLESGRYKLMTITHVDTSTAVLADVAGLTHLANQYGVISIVDGVCSVAGEALDMASWDVDLAITASQKAVGIPPGLALIMAGPRALQAFRSRKTQVKNYYGDWANWLPVMQAYEARKPAYFGTPAVNLVFALNVSLGQIISEGIDARVVRHRMISQAVKAGIKALGLSQVPVDPGISANTITAPRYPTGVIGPEFLNHVSNAGVILAGGLHPDIRALYFRIGHMGAVNLGDVLTTIGAIEIGLRNCGYQFEPGIGVSAAISSAHKSAQGLKQ